MHFTGEPRPRRFNANVFGGQHFADMDEFIWRNSGSIYFFLFFHHNIQTITQ